MSGAEGSNKPAVGTATGTADGVQPGALSSDDDQRLAVEAGPARPGSMGSPEDEPGGEGEQQSAVSPKPEAGKGFWIRALAFIIDWLLLLAALRLPSGLLRLGVPFASIMAELRESGVPLVIDAPPPWVTVAASLVLFFLYFLTFEALFGASPGKLILGMRVVKLSGMPCDFKAATIRGLWRFIDGLFLGVPAAASMDPPLQQRTGDRKAHTFVVGRRASFLQERRPGWRFVLACALLALGVVLASLGLVASGATFLRGGDAQAWRAFASFAEGDYAQALVQYEDALDLGVSYYRPDQVYVQLGMTRWQLGQIDRAEEAFDSAVAINPAYSLAWSGLGTVYKSRGNWQLAEEHYLRALELDRDDVQAHMGLGEVSLEQGDPGRAVSYFEQAVELGPANQNLRAYLALAYALAGRFDDADAALNMARRLGYPPWAELQHVIDELRSGE